MFSAFYADFFSVGNDIRSSVFVFDTFLLYIYVSGKRIAVLNLSILIFLRTLCQKHWR